MESGKRPYLIVAVLIMLLHTAGVQAQLTTGGDVCGGYLNKHQEESGNLWLGYKARDYDWRLSLTGSHSISRHAMTSTGDGRIRAPTVFGSCMTMNTGILRIRLWAQSRLRVKPICFSADFSIRKMSATGCL